jgi:hypothetical protein
MKNYFYIYIYTRIYTSLDKFPNIRYETVVVMNPHSLRTHKSVHPVTSLCPDIWEQWNSNAVRFGLSDFHCTRVFWNNRTATQSIEVCRITNL